MKLYLDSSKPEEVKRWLPVIDGVTTNPSILLKEGGSIEEVLKLVSSKPVSIEACGDFITDARKYSLLASNVVIKVPLLRPGKGDNLQLIADLVKSGIKINCTALFSLPQVILASKVGAQYVSLFIGRIDDEGNDVYSAIKECTKYLRYERVPSQLILGSIRTVSHVVMASSLGVDIVTVSPSILGKMLEHKFSRATVEQFESDSKKISR